MKIIIEVEPVLIEGRVSSEKYYGFRIIGLKDGLNAVPEFPPQDLIVRSSAFSYPGNDAVREFINKRSRA